MPFLEFPIHFFLLLCVNLSMDAVVLLRNFAVLNFIERGRKLDFVIKHNEVLMQLWPLEPENGASFSVHQNFGSVYHK